MHKFTAATLARAVAGCGGIGAPTRALRQSYEEEEELMRMQQEMMQHQREKPASSYGAGPSSDAHNHNHQHHYNDEYDNSHMIDHNTQQQGGASSSTTSGGNSSSPVGSYSALERRRAQRRNLKGTAPTIGGVDGSTTNNSTGSGTLSSPTPGLVANALGNADAVAAALRIVEERWIGKIEEEDNTWISAEAVAADGSSGNSLSTAETPAEIAAERFSDLSVADQTLLGDFVAARPHPSIPQVLKMLDNCKSAVEVEAIYKNYIAEIPLWSDVLNGHGTRVVIIGKLTELVARTFCVDQWLEIVAHARRYGFTITRLHVNEVLTSIRIDASAMFHQRGRDPSLVLKTIHRLQLLLHMSKEDHIRWEGVFTARLCLICTVLVSFMDRQNYYRSSFPSDFHRRDGVVGDWVITHVRAIDYDETVRFINKFLKEEGLDDHRHYLKIRPAFTTTYRLMDYYFASDNLSQTIATVEDAMRQGVNIAESTIAKMMQLAVSFNYPRSIELFRKYRLRMPEAVIATPDVSRLMTFYCRSGGGLPCPCCGEPYNHRNPQLSVWESTPAFQKRCPLLRMARDQRGELEELARNDPNGKKYVSGGNALLESFRKQQQMAAEEAKKKNAAKLNPELTTTDANGEDEAALAIDKSIAEQLKAAEMSGDEDALLTAATMLSKAKMNSTTISNVAGAGDAEADNAAKLMANIDSPTDTYVDLPQCRDWSHIAFSLFEYSQQNNLLWSITEWRLFLQCCTYLREPEEIIAQAERDVRRARALRKDQLRVDPDMKWAVVDPPHLASVSPSSSSANEPSFMASNTDGSKKASSSSPDITYGPCDTNAEVNNYLDTFKQATVNLPLSFANKHGLISAGPNTVTGKVADQYDPEDDDGTQFVAVPWLKLTKAVKFDFANSVIFRSNINFVTQVDDFVQRLYLRFLRCNNPQAVDTVINDWFRNGVGSGRGSKGGEIAPIVSEEIMIAAFGISTENVDAMKNVGGGNVGSLVNHTTLYHVSESTDDDGSSNESTAPLITVNSTAVAELRSNASYFTATRVHQQDLFVTAFAKRRARHEMFKNGFLIKVKRSEIPRGMMNNFYRRQRDQHNSAFAAQHTSGQSSADEINHRRYGVGIDSIIDANEPLHEVILPPIDISRYPDDNDAAEKDYFYVINPYAYGGTSGGEVGVNGNDFRFTSPNSLMSPTAATKTFAHLLFDGNPAEAALNEATIRRFVFLMRKKPRNVHARATFKDSGADVSPGYNKKNWHMVPR